MACSPQTHGSHGYNQLCSGYAYPTGMKSSPSKESKEESKEPTPAPAVDFKPIFTVAALDRLRAAALGDEESHTLAQLSPDEEERTASLRRRSVQVLSHHSIDNYASCISGSPPTGAHFYIEKYSAEAIFLQKILLANENPHKKKE